MMQGLMSSYSGFLTGVKWHMHNLTVSQVAICQMEVKDLVKQLEVQTTKRNITLEAQLKMVKGLHSSSPSSPWRMVVSIVLVIYDNQRAWTSKCSIFCQLSWAKNEYISSFSLNLSLVSNHTIQRKWQKSEPLPNYYSFGGHTRVPTNHWDQNVHLSFYRQCETCSFQHQWFW